MLWCRMIYTFPPWNIHSTLHFKPVLRGNSREVNSKSQPLVRAYCSPWTVPSFVFINLFNPDSVLVELRRWLSGWRIYLQCRSHRRLRFNPWVRKIPWRRKWQPTLVFLPEKSRGQRRLAGYSPTVHGVTKSWCISIYAVSDTDIDCYRDLVSRKYMERKHCQDDYKNR